MKIDAGIDLGTTNSVFAFANPKLNGDITSKVIDITRPVDMYGRDKLSNGRKAVLPSCVYYVEEKNYAPIIGDFAKNQYSVRPYLVAKSIKSQMGNPVAEGLSPDIPDKTPAQISAQILKHMVKDAAKKLNVKTDDINIIITVPANFDSSMCRATRDAAEIAGIKVKNPDGSERPILLSEPNAVIYDLFNQIRNGEIPSTILNLETTQTVLVFDIGGGTLDITMHQIKKRDDPDGNLKIDEIATNRYTLLGGDDFDQIIADKMYERYLAQYQKSNDAVAMIRQKKAEVMSQLITYAENLKIELNDTVGNDNDDDSWFDNEEDITVGGNIHSTGYSYDDTFTQNDIEDILSVFMAKELSFDDYKRIESITDTKNIIFPILDVLNKASKKLNTNEVKVDAVILNGGMSKFYMISKRLTDFFGFEPIKAVDPDQSVARGAAVYSYLLSHGNDDLADDMRIVGNVTSDIPQNEPLSPASFKKTDRHIGIEWGRNILNDSLYLGMRNGAVEEIIPTGAELPYSSPIKRGFGIQPGQNGINFQIKSRNLDGSYRIIANSTVMFQNNSKKTKMVDIKIDMDINKVITMKAWIYNFGSENQHKRSIGDVKISIDNKLLSNKNNSGKMLPPTGSKLNAKAEIDSLVKLCTNFGKPNTGKNNISERIKSAVSTICSCANPDDFAPEIISKLREGCCNEAKMRLYIISRRIMKKWTEKDRRLLASQCMNQLGGALNGFTETGMKKYISIQAIYTLSFCGNVNQFKRLEKLHTDAGYHQACLYAHAVSKTSIDWLAEMFYNDYKIVNDNQQTQDHLQFTAYAIGLALSSNSDPGISKRSIQTIITKLVSLINSSDLKLEQLVSCILALGWICDINNINAWNIDNKIVDNAAEALENVEIKYSKKIIYSSSKARSVAKKLIYGQQLSNDDEKFLLEKITI